MANITSVSNKQEFGLGSIATKLALYTSLLKPRVMSLSIFTSFVGDTIQGTNTITGGTGKYIGISGSGPWVCKDFPNGASSCKQSLNYKLP